MLSMRFFLRVVSMKLYELAFLLTLEKSMNDS